MSDTLEIENAAIAAKAARVRLTATTHELQARLTPATLIEDVKTGVRSGAIELADNAGEAARRRPGAAVGIAALVSIFLLRRPARRLGRRLFRRKATRERSRR